MYTLFRCVYRSFTLGAFFDFVLRSAAQYFDARKRAALIVQRVDGTEISRRLQALVEKCKDLSAGITAVAARTVNASAVLAPPKCAPAFGKVDPMVHVQWSSAVAPSSGPGQIGGAHVSSPDQWIGPETLSASERPLAFSQRTSMMWAVVPG